MIKIKWGEGLDDTLWISGHAVEKVVVGPHLGTSTVVFQSGRSQIVRRPAADVADAVARSLQGEVLDITGDDDPV